MRSERMLWVIGEKGPNVEVLHTVVGVHEMQRSTLAKRDTDQAIAVQTLDFGMA